MEKIIITATAESIDQVKSLLAAGVDRIYVGEADYGLRLPHAFSYDDLRQIAALVHKAGKELTVACNALMHQDMMDRIKPFLDLMKEIAVDYLVVGDAGVFYVNKRDGYDFKLIYDTSVFVTSSRQVNFWGQHGAVESVLAREIPSEELFALADNLDYPAEILVYGASVIHHSKRPLLENYYHFTKIDDEVSRERGLFLAEPGDPDSHYSIYEDNHGTHIFINNDIDMMTKLGELYAHGLTHWKLDGVYCPGENFVAITKLFIKAKALLESGQFTTELAQQLDAEVQGLHPVGRGLDTGFYDFDPKTVK
ncbi:TPA: U32 family peptidase [Streptococcus equi subsp. zooepidemicus]|uniref:Putative peptidase n=1 Tax=Streptococcus equi subsp. zooepidemicus (strain H70) TaxID=553483 RepID=C0MD03_STRS7|nr:peptidase U32 family protein [Streptococcus equi]KIS06678.1 peptidase [Streptococcus equi subsp. zooepidemicus Sz16]MCD3399295.1 U32 family peptidase [Streptococcus equi subsp. zooepidemicus]MCD3409765.1 U32 family peptidase [Streptococcus equi subsp. zooepidemicus]MCD3429937.1 U32 family peptidase [Streptococcus equi subsp. zooepidemicus]MCD3444889.1 U32 family peptidase [Streptococcus equi subsp. zooepidemicus]